MENEPLDGPGGINPEIIPPMDGPGIVPMSSAEDAIFAAVGSGVILFILVFFLAVYVYMALCLMKIAKKTNTPNEWMAWIPFANIVLMIQIARKPMWWIIFILLAFIPIVGPIAMLAVIVLLWMAISERLGRDKWLGILMAVPIANLFLPGYLAFTDAPSTPSEPVTTEPDANSDASGPEVPTVSGEKVFEEKEPVADMTDTNKAVDDSADTNPNE